MTNPLQNPNFLHEQYATQDNLQVRIDTHARYSETTVDFPAWVLDQIPWRGDETVLDVGCGSGAYALPAQARAGRYVAGDRSIGMLRALPAPITRRVNLDAQQLPPAPITRRVNLDAQQLPPAPITRRVNLDTQQLPPAPITRRVNLDAQQLPLASGSVDVLLANHMLYHVPDIAAAAGEFARVLKPAGTLLAATNSNDNHRELYELVDRALAALGSPARQKLRPAHDFRLENGAAWLRPRFGEVTRHDLPGALLFQEPEPVIRYLLSMLAQMAPALTALPLERVVKALDDELRAVIAAEGVFRTRKIACVFVCRHPIAI